LCEPIASLADNDRTDLRSAYPEPNGRVEVGTISGLPPPTNLFALAGMPAPVPGESVAEIWGAWVGGHGRRMDLRPKRDETTRRVICNGKVASRPQLGDLRRGNRRNRGHRRFFRRLRGLLRRDRSWSFDDAGRKQEYQFEDDDSRAISLQTGIPSSKIKKRLPSRGAAFFFLGEAELPPTASV
jgi:hypothetical protein